MVAAIGACRDDVVKILLASDLDVHFTDDRGWTALDMSLRKGDVYQTLLEAGCRHSIFYAIEEEKLEVLVSLVSEGADVSVRNKVSNEPGEAGLEDGRSAAARAWNALQTYRGVLWLLLWA